jgi:CBS domain-containing protein
MQAKEAMTGNPEIISPDATILEAARKMAQLDVGALPICQADKVIGVITDRDIVVRAVTEKLDPSICKVKEIMSSNVITCKEGDDILQCAHMMEDRQIRRIIVTDNAGKPCGILSLGDIATKCGHDLGAEVITQVSQPGHHAGV